MDKYLILCRSLTRAQRAAGALERAGILSAITKAPQTLTPDGCTYALRLSAEKGPRALAVLDGAGLDYGRVYRLSEDGTPTEVSRR